MPITLIVAIVLIALVFAFFFIPSAKQNPEEESVNSKKILAAKVSLEIYESFVKLAQEKNLTISSYLRTIVVDVIENNKLPKGESIPTMVFRKPKTRTKFYWSKSALSDGIISESKLNTTPSFYMRKKYPDYIKRKIVK
jgi:antitoxin component of RelBE/YafQ-DinJ toxin-antitoxin module